MTRYSALLSLVLWLGSFSLAYAADFTVSPKIVDLTLVRRDESQQTVVVENTSGGPLTVFPFVNNVTVGVSGGVEQFLPPSMSDRSATLSSWIEISRSGIDLKAGEKKEIPLTIHVNPTAAPGTYHALVSYARGGNATEAEQVFNNGDAPAVMVNVTVPDNQSEELSLSRFFVKKFVTGTNDSDVQYLVNNPGDKPITPEGDIIFYDQRGEEVGSIPINPNKETVESGATRTFTAAVPTKGLLGKYKAYMAMHYGENQANIYDTVYFYVLPWKKVLVIFIVFILCALGLSLYAHHRYMKRHPDDDDDADHLYVEVNTSPSAKYHDRDIVMKR